MMLTKVPESETKSSTESGSGNKVPVLVPWEEHQKLIDEAAKRASQETLESFRKLDKAAISDRESSRDEGGEESDGEELDFFATKTNKSIKNMVSSVATLKRAFEQPPSQIESMLYNAFTQNMVQKLTDGGEKKKNWYDEILSSLAHGVGQRGPELIESLTRNFGSEWVKQTATGLLNPGAVINSGGPGGGGYGGQGDQGQGRQGQGNRGAGGNNSNLNQDAVDQIMALDPNNPEHVAAYAEIQGNIDINDARKMLQIHQDIFMNKMKRNISQLGAENPSGPVNVPVNPGVSSVNPDIPPVWAQAMMGKLLELEKKVNDNIGISSVESTHVDSNIGKVQTVAEFQRELEEETRREKEKSGIGNVNKWEDDLSVAVGVVSHERRLEEDQMRKKPLHDASADMIRKEVDVQKEKLKKSEVITTLENFEDLETEKSEVVIPEDINSDVNKIEEEVGKEDTEEENVKEEGNNVKEEGNNVKEEGNNVKEEGNNVKSTDIVLVPENETKADLSNIMSVKKYAKGSQGWLREQKELKEKANK